MDLSLREKVVGIAAVFNGKIQFTKSHAFIWKTTGQIYRETDTVQGGWPGTLRVFPTKIFPRMS